MACGIVVDEKALAKALQNDFSPAIALYILEDEPIARISPWHHLNHKVVLSLIAVQYNVETVIRTGLS
ncbi:MAG: hypothetical protein CMM28_04890 [Rhodospirillaceae bacterium]|nr:hypothetical protein [Rhodospirillaceae bacterium]|tara:strand:+ start:103 stop:306 length:204 start_codon:yes stop_codon:yes gene_type:complete